ncbi:MAG: hypothetical protein QM500_17645 [Methylococcales bacterium]
MKLYTSLFIILITLGFTKNTMSENNILSADYYFLKAETHDAIVTININDAQIIRSPDTDSLNTIVPMNTWLTEGENVISINISPPPNNTKDYNPNISISVFLHDPKSETPLPKTMLATLKYRNKDEDIDKIKFPLSRSVKFDFNKSIPNKLWNTASDLTAISELDKTEIVNTINLLTSSLTSNNISKAIELQKFKLNEEALSVNKQYSEFEHAATTTYKLLADQTNLISQPVEVESLEFNICGKNKLVLITTTKGENAISFSSDEMDFELEVFMAKIDGKWTIAR